METNTFSGFIKDIGSYVHSRYNRYSYILKAHIFLLYIRFVFHYIQTYLYMDQLLGERLVCLSENRVIKDIGRWLEPWTHPGQDRRITEPLHEL